MNISNVKMLCAVLITFAIFFSSCNTVRLNQGFNYKPTVEGPSIGSQPVEESHSNTNTAENIEVREKTIENATNLPENHLNLQEEDLSKVIGSNQEILVETQKPKEIRKTFQFAVNQYAVEHEKTFTKRQQKKLSKIAEILEHKASFSSIYWAPETNVELFFLMGAGLGLLVGLLSIGLGWFIFIVFSLLYLYFKLIA
jgi:hypothetical protein